MVKNVIKGSFPMSKVIVFEGNSFICGKNEDIRQFYDCKWYVEKMKILDYFMIANDKEYD